MSLMHACYHAVHSNTLWSHTWSIKNTRFPVFIEKCNEGVVT